ncbi:oxaloacetate decarboxylase [Rhizobium sp. P32RR-XVIII]|uniref:isocitrate lyase/PEP mutase family protein n=1 Tax=Rhizobium sp. P32RR-XVIII TaxID=2726738 RepID=UPI00145750AC|nr:isocitrate lyase/phosphoenolpyruvate mutase family protein [Rhizobium sp. P32RR-XVIII]NLS07571.1 oxaloacetate decarboxylase [Rhizobium sp. P32RR-XVIII]
MNTRKRREHFRGILEGDICVHPASVFDALSARAASELGFELTMLAGSIASMAVLGDPDICLISMTEFVDLANRICRAAETPLLVDADHGYGNALNVMRTVEELETAGVAALTIEDTELPRAFACEGAARLISREEGIGKMCAALEARQDPALAIIGRTSAVALSGLDDAILRLKAYERAGVDALFLTGVKQRAQVDAIAEAVSIPLILGAAAPELKDSAYLRERRVKISLQGHQPFLAAVQAMYGSLRALREGTPPSEITGLPSDDLMAGLTRRPAFEHWLTDFLSSPLPDRD